MSLNGDLDYQLLLLRLSFLSAVPGAASLLSAHGAPGPSLYLQHSQLLPPPGSGRVSPPLADHERQGLKYSATVGKAGGAGMRVTGVRRTRADFRAAAAKAAQERARAAEAEEPTVMVQLPTPLTSPVSTTHRPGHQSHAKRDRLPGHHEHLEEDSLMPVSASSDGGSTSTSDDEDHPARQSTLVPAPKAVPAEDDETEYDAEQEDHSLASIDPPPPVVEAGSEEALLPHPPSPSSPLAQSISQSMSMSMASSSLLALSDPTPSSASASQPRGLGAISMSMTGRSFASSSLSAPLSPISPSSADALSLAAGPAPAVGVRESSTAARMGEGSFASSSGVSLFAPQTAAMTRTDSELGSESVYRGRSDSEASLVVPPPPPAAAPTSPGQPSNGQQLKPPFRMRERRRVNIPRNGLGLLGFGGGGAALPAIAEPEPVASSSSSSSEREEEHSPKRGRSNTTPSGADQPGGTGVKILEGVPEGSVGEEGVRGRKRSAPGAMEHGGVVELERERRKAAKEQEKEQQQHNIIFPTREEMRRAMLASRQGAVAPEKGGRKRSALTEMLVGAGLAGDAQDGAGPSKNPLGMIYETVYSRPPDALSFTIFFPASKGSKGKGKGSMKLDVKKDATIEEVLGAALARYWDEGWEPPLTLDETEDGTGALYETAKWALRITEDDGEVDDDFPALDRARKVSAFRFTEFAVVRSPPAQERENRAKQTALLRTVNRQALVVAGGGGNGQGDAQQQQATLVPGGVVGPAASFRQQLQLSESLLGTTANPVHAGADFMAPSVQPNASSTRAVPVLLRINVKLAADVNTVTTISVPSDMYLADVRDHVCQKRGIEGNTKEWAFTVVHQGSELVVPLDRTVESLGERRDLDLVKRGAGQGWRGGPLALANLKNTNPSASIFQAGTDDNQPRYVSVSDIVTSSYQAFNVQRKLPMPLSRHDRVLAIDGDYIHITSSVSDGRVRHGRSGALDGGRQGRTSSYHVKDVRECRTSKRAPSSFRLVVQRGRTEKRYDFEADSPRMAAEIVRVIAAAKTEYDHSAR